MSVPSFEVPHIIGTLISFAVGSIPFGYLLVRWVLKIDIKSEGSGNIGATNVARVAGKKLGIATLFLDIAKGLVCVTAAGALGYTGEVAAVFGFVASFWAIVLPLVSLQRRQGGRHRTGRHVGAGSQGSFVGFGCFFSHLPD